MESNRPMDRLLPEYRRFWETEVVLAAAFVQMIA